MDRDTRNAIERATQRARQLLEDDFVSQLEGTYDVLRSGEVAATGGPHLTAQQRVVREKIVASVEHKRAAGAKPREAVAGYARDAAFTALNRFVALKMLEARGLLQECVTKGELSSGYKEFYGLAPGVALLPDGAGYRLYVECLFDELSTEVKVLFDRRDPASALWPRRQTFDELFELLNAPELGLVWGEDETIGWVYQFFNSGDERYAMREVSPIPQDSRELAVRNQFFTPRYVVAFLTENTVGRTWIEMMGESTRIADRCEFLVAGVTDRGDRLKKDPRDIRVLDPACGSGHFLLYAFDLFVTIYEEAWNDSNAAQFTGTGRTLREDYSDLGTLRRSLPLLLLRCNLYGVDIDPRCAQIAQLALWMRAQRAFRDFGISPADRPAIRRSNVVVAEPLVTDEKTSASFLATLGDAELGQIFSGLTDSLKVAGDLGLLLRVEDLIAPVTKRGETGELFPPPELGIRAALQLFASTAGSIGMTRRRLFADDAEQGVGLLEIAEKTFDVVLMNPPFGDATTDGRNYLETHYPVSWKDLFRAFVERAVELAPDGLIGALGPRTSLFLPHGEAWRRAFLIEHSSLHLMADLGIGVLDAAKIEVAAYVLGPPGAKAIFLRAIKTYDKPATLKRLCRCETADIENRLVFVAAPSEFQTLPAAAFAYWVSPAFRTLFGTLARTEGTLGEARVGLQTSDDFRFIRLRWEVEEIGPQWACLAKGGEYSPFYSDVHLVVRWEDDGREVCEFNEARYGSASRNVRSKDRYFERGITWSPRTTTEFAPRVLPDGCIFGQKGPSLLVCSAAEGAWALAVLNSRVYQYLLTIGAGAADIDPGSISKSYGVGLVQSTPVPATPSSVAAELAVKCWWRRHEVASRLDTTSGHFCGLPEPVRSDTPTSWVVSMCTSAADAEREVLEAWEALGQHVFRAYGLSEQHVRELDDEVGTLWGASVFESLAQSEEDAENEDELGGRLTPRGWGFVRRNARQSGISPSEVMLRLNSEVARSEGLLKPFASEALEYYVGVAFGVWRRRCVNWPAEAETMFAANPKEPPALAPNPLSILVNDPGHPEDITGRVEDALTADWSHCQESASGTLVALAGYSTGLRDYLARAFFPEHLRRFSRSRRRAPLFWQLGTPSASYSVWLYSRTIRKDTLHRLQSEYVAPKLALEERRLEALRKETSGGAAGRKKVGAQETFVDELREFLFELKRVAPMWQPEPNDGVILNCAPLWRLVPQHRTWQKELRATWQSLVKGDYDWARMAMHLWPERVVQKCAADRSLAIAHGLEDVFWERNGSERSAARENPRRPIEELVRERTSPAAKEALSDLLRAPSIYGAGRARVPATVNSRGGT